MAPPEGYPDANNYPQIRRVDYPKPPVPVRSGIIDVAHQKPKVLPKGPRYVSMSSWANRHSNSCGLPGLQHSNSGHPGNPADSTRSYNSPHQPRKRPTVSRMEEPPPLPTHEPPERPPDVANRSAIDRSNRPGSTRHNNVPNPNTTAFFDSDIEKFMFMSEDDDMDVDDDNGMEGITFKPNPPKKPKLQSNGPKNSTSSIGAAVNRHVKPSVKQDDASITSAASVAVKKKNESKPLAKPALLAIPYRGTREAFTLSFRNHDNKRQAPQRVLCGERVVGALRNAQGTELSNGYVGTKVACRYGDSDIATTYVKFGDSIIGWSVADIRMWRLLHEIVFNQLNRVLESPTSGDECEEGEVVSKYRGEGAEGVCPSQCPDIHILIIVQQLVFSGMLCWSLYDGNPSVVVPILPYSRTQKESSSMPAPAPQGDNSRSTILTSLLELYKGTQSLLEQGSHMSEHISNNCHSLNPLYEFRNVLVTPRAMVNVISSLLVYISIVIEMTTKDDGASSDFQFPEEFLNLCSKYPCFQRFVMGIIDNCLCFTNGDPVVKGEYVAVKEPPKSVSTSYISLGFMAAPPPVELQTPDTFGRWVGARSTYRTVLLQPPDTATPAELMNELNIGRLPSSGPDTMLLLFHGACSDPEAIVKSICERLAIKVPNISYEEFSGRSDMHRVNSDANGSTSGNSDQTPKKQPSDRSTIGKSPVEGTQNSTSNNKGQNNINVNATVSTQPAGGNASPKNSVRKDTETIKKRETPKLSIFEASGCYDARDSPNSVAPPPKAKKVATPKSNPNWRLPWSRMWHLHMDDVSDIKVMNTYLMEATYRTIASILGKPVAIVPDPLGLVGPLLLALREVQPGSVRVARQINHEFNRLSVNINANYGTVSLGDDPDESYSCKIRDILGSEDELEGVFLPCMSTETQEFLLAFFAILRELYKFVNVDPPFRITAIKNTMFNPKHGDTDVPAGVYMTFKCVKAARRLIVPLYEDSSMKVLKKISVTPYMSHTIRKKMGFTNKVYSAKFDVPIVTLHVSCYIQFGWAISLNNLKKKLNIDN